MSQTKMPYEKDHIDSVKINDQTRELFTQRKENFTAPKFKDAWKDLTVKSSTSPDYKDYAEFILPKLQRTDSKIDPASPLQLNMESITSFKQRKEKEEHAKRNNGTSIPT